MAFACWFAGLRHLPAGAVGVVGLLNPMTGVLLGTVVASESLSYRQWVGFGVACLGVAVAQVARHAPDAARQAPHTVREIVVIQSSYSVDVRVLGGPTTVIEIGGLRLLTDPTFDDARDYELGPGLVLSKIAPSPISVEDVGPIDAVLLSHHQHPDNLDESGRAYLGDAALVLTTPSAAKDLGGSTRGLQPWEVAELSRPDGSVLTVTAAPARHGPEGCEPVIGEVTGFVLAGDRVPTTYVSGDNASLEIVEQIAGRVGPVDTAVIFAGAARTPLFDGALVTLERHPGGRGRTHPRGAPGLRGPHRQLGALHRGPGDRRGCVRRRRPRRPSTKRPSAVRRRWRNALAAGAMTLQQSGALRTSATSPSIPVVETHGGQVHELRTLQGFRSPSNSRALARKPRASFRAPCLTSDT